MRKYRSWLLGFGIGIILGASMLQLILLAQKQAVMVAEPLTREELNAEAKKAGLVLLTTEQLETKINEAVASVQKDSGQETDDINSGMNDTESALTPPGANEEGQPSATPTDGAESEQPEASASEPANTEEFTLYIRYGMSLTEVANALFEQGIIEDTKDFINEARPIAKKMNVGNAVFIGKPTVKEIMSELTRKK
ncbi:hypothetical protein [Cohnella cholangitidis]|uniref:YceG-like family protein n=1 Tax=Cohnella cholangitidis TaxID=2598458 RepID=A0A7G5BT56_9BACL|nr:hypothetical protein [Cohnella cholangitidis]QMV40140.1 hypothetical protein FPL14_02195 [Cohnella cholangitidis]